MVIYFGVFVWFMVFNTIFNNISVLLVEETGVPVENHRPVASHWQTLSHNTKNGELSSENTLHFVH
jgi:hypothetical protein